MFWLLCCNEIWGRAADVRAEAEKREKAGVTIQGREGGTLVVCTGLRVTEVMKSGHILDLL